MTAEQGLDPLPEWPRFPGAPHGHRNKRSATPAHLGNLVQGPRPASGFAVLLENPFDFAWRHGLTLRLTLTWTILRDSRICQYKSARYSHIAGFETMPKRSDISDRRIPVNRAAELLGSLEAVQARARSYRTWRDWIEYGVPPKHLSDVLKVKGIKGAVDIIQMAPIPVFGFGSAGEGIITDDEGYPIGNGELYIDRSAGNVDPRSYATRVKGESMYPYLFDGDIVEVRTDLEVRGGDVAVILHEDGRKWIKRIKLPRSKPVVICQPINGGHEPFEIPLEKVRLHKIISIRRKGMY